MFGKTSQEHVTTSKDQQTTASTFHQKASQYAFVYKSSREGILSSAVRYDWKCTLVERLVEGFEALSYALADGTFDGVVPVRLIWT